VNISVIIPSYNRYLLLKRAVNSILLQNYQADEIIVIDDGSTDNTAKITQDFPSIKYFFQKNHGVSSARNLGVSKAKNEWLAFLDSDDEWHKSKLQEQVAFHQKNPDILMSYTAEKWVRNGQEVKIPKKFRKIGKNIFSENLSYCNLAPSSVLLHKNLLDEVGVFDESLRVCEDYDLWLRILCKHDIGLLDKTLITKHAGHDEQLGFAKDMDKIRIKVLEKLLKNCKNEEKKNLIEKELLGKCAK